MVRTEPPGDVNEPLNGAVIGDLLRKAWSEAGRLARFEFESARVELAGKAKSAGAGVAMLVVALLLVVPLTIALTACAILALSLVVPAWAAALIVAAAWALAAALFAVVGIARVRAALPPFPQRTASSVREDITWVKRRTTSARA